MFPNLSNLPNYGQVHALRPYPCILATIEGDADGSAKKDKRARGEWQAGLFGLNMAYDSGLNCFVQHCCCQPCVVASAMENAKLSNGLFVATGLAIGSGTVSALAGYYARRQVVYKYNIKEGELNSFLSACFCLPCSNLQLVSTVAENEGLKYGCASVNKPADTTSAVSGAVMDRV